MRQTHHVSSLNSFPETRFGGSASTYIMWPRSTPFPNERRVWCGSHIMWPRTTSFPGPAYLQLNSVHMPFFSASEAVVHGPPWHAESTMLQSTRCCSFKGDRVPVSMNSGTFEEARGRRRRHETHCPSVFTGIAASCDDEPGSLEENGRKTPNSFKTAPGSSLVSPLPSWSSPLKVRRRTHEFPIASGVAGSDESSTFEGTSGRRRHH